MLSAHRVAVAIVLAALLGCPAAEKKCPAGQTNCFGNCVDAQTDANACGPGCATCPTGGSCVTGVCECPPGLIACAGACVDTQVATNHCGACNHGCGVGTCAAGTCTCDAGATECFDAFWPRCVETAVDPNNCGTCRNVCPLAHDVCVASVCTCPPSLPAACPTTVPTACVNLQTDEGNCGGCDLLCATGATCTTGACHCPGTEVVCGTAPGACTDTSTDAQHCGSCTTPCATGASCVSSGCVCPAGKLQICGAASGNPGKCCAGSGCCAAGACQTAHSNGLGQSYYDCNPLGPPLTRDRAMAAATAWKATGTNVDYFCSGNCIYHQDLTQIPNTCATWCYDGNFAGQVSLNGNDAVCTCPPGGTFVGNWN